MHFTTSFIATVLAMSTSAISAPLEARQSNSPLQDWQVSQVSWSSPSGRPGSYPFSSLIAEATDPNEINLGPSKVDGKDVIVPAGSKATNCKAQWFRGENPLGRTWPCDAVSDGYWVMNVLAGEDGTFSTTNFNLKFTHKADLINFGSEYNATFEATGNFGVGKNMGGSCGASGVCGWGLKEENKPFAITPKQV
ncbi:hypothetical protein ACN47E_007864 [Coniothyrium glycines]